jgi:hypothetical protein
MPMILSFSIIPASRAGDFFVNLATSKGKRTPIKSADFFLISLPINSWDILISFSSPSRIIWIVLILSRIIFAGISLNTSTASPLREIILSPFCNPASIARESQVIPYMTSDVGRYSSPQAKSIKI